MLWNLFLLVTLGLAWHVILAVDKDTEKNGYTFTNTVPGLIGVALSTTAFYLLLDALFQVEEIR